MIEAFASKPRDLQFVCLGKLDPDNNAYHAEVLKAGEGRVLFPGAIYDPAVVQALRFHAAAYCHGHSVGGTNPSLVEALGAGNAVIGHDNPTIAGSPGPSSSTSLMRWGSRRSWNVSTGQPELLVAAGQAARRRFDSALTWGPVLEAYEEACRAALNPGASSGPSPNPAWTA
jgi:hypothetical protein